jgi:hypothetical protein
MPRPSRPGESIGVKNESSLHRALKYTYAETGITEKMVGDYVCDGVSENGDFIEVQTGSFGPLKQKIPVLAATAPVRIIHPIILTTYIETFDESGALIRRRKSPRKGTKWDLFDALLYAPELPLVKNVTIELTLLDVTEKRVDDGKGSWRRRGISIADREILAWHETIPLLRLRDYLPFVPFTKKETFTARDLAERAGISPASARKCLYVLTRLRLVKRVDKQGNWIVYQRAGQRGRT